MVKLFIDDAPSSRLSRGYTLDDLEENEEFQEVSERFLESVGENSNDIFEYLRDSDFNLFSGMQRAMESGKFTEQQKKDYRFLRNRFDKADMGSFRQYAELAKDAVVDIATDPTAIAATLLTPVTGGSSLASRAVLAKGATEGLKNISKSAKRSVGFTAAEVGTWTGLENHFRQNTELNTDMRKLYSNSELAGSAAIGALTGGLVGGLVRRNEIFEDRLQRLYTDDGFRKEAGSDRAYNFRKAKDKILGKTIGSPARVLQTISEYSPKARDLGETFTHEFGKTLTQRTRRRRGFSYAEDLGDRRGNYLLDFDAAVSPIRTTGQVLPEDEIAVIRILRGGDDSQASEAVKQTAKNLRTFFDKISDEAAEAGLDPKKIEDYFPRQWNREAIKNNRTQFEKRLVEKGIVSEDEVKGVVDGMLNKQNELYGSHSNLLTQSRVFKDLKDNEFEEFLTNDLVPVATNYYMNAARSIQVKKSFLGPGKDVGVVGKTEEENLILFKKSNEDQFVERFINPIDDELTAARGKGLTARDKKDILNVFKSITGQVDYFDSGLMQGIYDTTKLANAVAYLPLATISSVTEALIPFAKAPFSSAVKGTHDAVAKGHKLLTDEMGQLIREKHRLSDDEIRREMNSVFIAVDEAMGDVTNRLSGEGLQNEFLKKQARRFYRFNLLVPWTKTVQLASFSTGKDLIRSNLELLNKGGLSKNKKERLEGELFDLGIDITKGRNWLTKGGKTDDPYYRDIIKGAGRFTNSIILQTSREFGTVPTYMTNPKVDIFTQFLRYPTVFGNTVLKNFARDAITDPTANAPKIAAFAVMATNVAKATNYWRTSEENRERIDKEGEDWRDTLKAFQRVGLLGPLEYGVRVTEGLSYGQNPLLATAGVGGPVINDIIGLAFYNRGLLETAARKAPLIGTKNIFDRTVGDIMEEYTGFREPYTPMQKAAKEATKSLRAGIRAGTDVFTGRETADDTTPRILRNMGGPVTVDPYTGQPYEERQTFVTGGLVEGVEDVPFTKEDPAERINKFTGEPYQEEMTRLGFKEGGVLDLIRLNRGDDVANSLVSYGDKVSEIESNNIPDRIQIIKRDGQFVEDGPGRGKYQFEMSYADGSGSAKNAVQRVLNLYKRYGQKAPERLVELSLEKDIDVSKLPESLQDDIFYANAAEHPDFKLDDLASGKLSEKDAWLNYHWAGKEEDRKSKSDLWDKRFVKEVVDNLQN
jgi:hypothetical protein